MFFINFSAVASYNSYKFLLKKNRNFQEKKKIPENLFFCEKSAHVFTSVKLQNLRNFKKKIPENSGI